MPSRKDRAMRLAIPVLAAAAAAALLPATAQAKELASARACDADGCHTITAAAALRGMEEGRPTDAPEQGAPFYRVRMRVDIPGENDYRYTLAYVPSGGLLRVEGQFDRYDWLAATPRGRRGFDRLTRGLEPVPAVELRGVGAEEVDPVARVDEVVQPPAAAPDDGGGFPWTVLLIPGALLLAAVAWVVRRRELPAPFRDRRARA
jgi:hypothetical protein